MSHHNVKTETAAVKVRGIDLAKQSFHLYGVDAAGHKVVSKKLGRKLGIPQPKAGLQRSENPASSSEKRMQKCGLINACASPEQNISLL